MKERRTQLSDLRLQLDALDDGLVDMLKRRMCLVQEIGQIKADEGLAVHQPQREAEMMERLCAQGNESLSPADIRTLFDAILSISRAAQARQREAKANG